MIAPSVGGEMDQGIPMNLSVNAAAPLYNAVLLTECRHIDPKTQELILMVKRWAKDRGLCHMARGHLSPYTWTLLTIFFLQVGTGDKDPMLPSLECFAKSSELIVNGGMAELPTPAAVVHPAKTKARPCSSSTTAGALFKEFVRFYAKEFDWRTEAVSIRHGKRAAPDVHLPLHIIVNDEDGTTEVGPSIEDPFEAAHNLGARMTAVSLKHLKAEFDRANDLCMNGVSLTKLLEPWAPADPLGNTAPEEEECE